MQLAIGKFRQFINIILYKGAQYLLLIVCLSKVVVGQAVDTIAVRVDSVEYMNELGLRLQAKPPSLLQLQARQHYVILKLAATTPKRVLYRMDGLDKEWFYGQSTERIHYAHLTGGTYVFRCKVVGGNTEYRLPISIDNPVWTRWWFWPVLILYAISVIGIAIYLLLQYRFRQRLRLYQSRDRIARDLHDDMGSYLSSISILSQTASRSATKDPAKTQATLERIGQTARHVMESMGDIVWSINPTHDSMEQVIARMTDVSSSLFGGNTEQTEHVAQTIDVADDVRQLSLSAENRRDFFLIYKEAITNVAKYAQATQVRISLRREGTNLVLTIQDNGLGFDMVNPVRINSSGGNGLRNMQTRAALLNGTLTVHSAIGQGTTVTLRIPV